MLGNTLNCSKCFLNVSITGADFPYSSSLLLLSAWGNWNLLPVCTDLPFLDTSYTRKWRCKLFLSASPHSAQWFVYAGCSQDRCFSPFCCWAVLRLNGYIEHFSPLTESAAGQRIVSSFWLLWITLLTFECKVLCVHVFSFLLGRCLGEELLGQMENDFNKLPTCFLRPASSHVSSNMCAEGSSHSASSPTFSRICLWVVAPLVGMECYFLRF